LPFRQLWVSTPARKQRNFGPRGVKAASRFYEQRFRNTPRLCIRRGSRSEVLDHASGIGAVEDQRRLHCRRRASFCGVRCLLTKRNKLSSTGAVELSRAFRIWPVTPDLPREIHSQTIWRPATSDSSNGFWTRVCGLMIRSGSIINRKLPCAILEHFK